MNDDEQTGLCGNTREEWHHWRLLGGIAALFVAEEAFVGKHCGTGPVEASQVAFDLWRDDLHEPLL